MKALFFSCLALGIATAGCQSKEEDETPKPPTAEFSYTGTAQNFTPIAFTSTAPSADTYAWKFGDGSTSTEANPSHTFRKAGNYTVTLNATGPKGTATTTQTLALVQADTLRILSERFTGSYRFVKSYKYEYSYSTKRDIITPLRDTIMPVIAGRLGLTVFGRGWTLIQPTTWRNRSQIPAYTYYSGTGSQLSSLTMQQTGDSISFHFNTGGGNGPTAPRSGIVYYGGRIR